MYPEEAQRLLHAVQRRLLRATTPDEVVAEVIAFVHALGAQTVPACEEDARTFPVDVSFGVLAEPLVPAAEPYSAARLHLETHLPTLVEDAHAVLARLR